MQADTDRFAESRLRHRLVVLAEKFSINFQAVRKLFIWNLPIEARFDDLEECARAAQSRCGFKAQRGGIAGEGRVLQELRALDQADFFLVAADLSDREVRRILRDRV